MIICNKKWHQHYLICDFFVRTKLYFNVETEIQEIIKQGIQSQLQLRNKTMNYNIKNWSWTEWYVGDKHAANARYSKITVIFFAFCYVRPKTRQRYLILNEEHALTWLSTTQRLASDGMKSERKVSAFGKQFAVRQCTWLTERYTQLTE